MSTSDFNKQINDLSEKYKKDVLKIGELYLHNVPELKKNIKLIRSEFKINLKELKVNLIKSRETKEETKEETNEIIENIMFCQVENNEPVDLIIAMNVNFLPTVSILHRFYLMCRNKILKKIRNKNYQKPILM
jgi:hypothetical protein